MYNARDILLLAAEDAFEFEKWRDAGPVIGDIDPEARAAEIAEFEALGVPMPAELDSLRRELEHAPKVSEAIRNSAIALRRSGRASASSLVALGPQQLMQPGARMGWMDPRLMAMAYMGMSAEPMPMQIRAEPPIQSVSSRSRRPRARKLADATVVAEDGSLEAEVVGRRYDDDVDDDVDDDDDADDDDDEFEPPPRSRKRESAGKAKGNAARKAKPARSREWDEDEDEDEDDDDISIVAAPVSVGSDRNTLILGGIAAVAVIAMLFMMLDKDDPPPVPPSDPALVQQQPQQQPPAPPPQPAIDPNTGLPYGQAPAPIAEAPAPAPAPAPSSSGRGGGGGSRGSGVRGSSTPASSGGTINPFADFKTDPTGGGAPAGGGPAPAGGGPAPAPAGGGQAPAPTPQPTPAPAPAPTPTDQATPPAEQPKPAEPPKSDDSLLTKSKMTPAIREAVVGKVGELQACYQDAMVGKPDLAGKVVFVISLDQDGVVTKVNVSVDEVGYGVAKCSAKKIKRWTLPSAGIPIIFDLPFDFKS